MGVSTRSALKSTKDVGKRWGLMIFGADPKQLTAVKRDMPLIGQLTLNVSRDEYVRHFSHEAPEYEEWAVQCLLRAMKAGFDVLALVTGSKHDLDDTLAPRVSRILTRLQHQLISKKSGRLIGVCFDLEWENDNFSYNGWRGYVDNVSNALRVMQEQFPEIRRFGPGGTHSDDKTLPDLLDRLAELGVCFTDITFHAYMDKGWDKFTKRINKLRSFFKSRGFATCNITEVGVTGEKNWSRDGLVGDPLENHYKRFGRMKKALDSWDDIELMQIYQIGESGVAEDHGQDFGMYTEDGVAKPSTEYFQ